MGYFKSTMSPEERVQIVELAKAGKTSKEIAEILGYSYPHIIKNSDGIFGKLRRQKRLEWDAQIYRMYAKGMRTREISRIMKTSQKMIQYSLRRTLFSE